MNGKVVGAFETFRVTDGKIFLFVAHMRRLAAACKRFGMAFPGEEKLKTKIKNELRKQITKKTQNADSDSDFRAKILAFPKSKFQIKLERIPQIKFQAVSCCFVNAAPSKYPFKSTDRKEYARCERIAKSMGFDLPILVDAKSGHVLEGSIANIFIVKDGAVVTPPVNGIVDGIARGRVISICKKLGLAVKIKSISKNDVLGADECFLTNALRFVMGVSRVDGKKYGSAKVARLLFGEYRKLAFSQSKFA